MSPNATAGKTLMAAMTDLSLDVEFATAALVPKERLSDMRETIDGRIGAMLDALETAPAPGRADLSTEIESLMECRNQILVRECCPVDMDVGHMIDVIDKGTASQVALLMLERSIEQLRDRYDNAVFATELAVRFNTSREANEMRFTVAHDFLVAMNIDSGLMTDAATVRREVERILLDVQKSVSASRA